MKKEIRSEKLPIKLWLDDIDEGALEQARHLANLPFIHKHIAVMPDAHLGYGMPIGGVMATHGVIIPNAVGVDIGCGMCALQTSLTNISTDQLKAIMSGIRRLVPLGFRHHDTKQKRELMPKPPAGRSLTDLPIVHQEYEHARTQLGTLGGGNHFIEIQKGSDGHIWVMIHSGSRNLGFKVANFYNRVACQLNAQWGSNIPPNWKLA
jgi:tRNA-splicing ligase RtcB